MLSLYNANGLVHWDERQIRLRESLITHFAAETGVFLRATNPAWDIRRVEAPLLIPRTMISDAYDETDVWMQQTPDPGAQPLVLRPETTPSTYRYMRHLLDSHQGVRLPLCVWQAGKSFRREQDQPSRHMRLKEFWQMEFQCAFTADTAMDYHAASLDAVRRMIGAQIALPTRVVASDRLPAYAEVTMDIEVDNGDKWMEICSISRRTDFPGRFRVDGRNGRARECDIRVLEIAIGLDRCIYNWLIAAGRAA